MKSSSGPDVSIIELIVVLLWIPSFFVCGIALIIGINCLALAPKQEHKDYTLVTLFAGIGVIASSLTLYQLVS